jgi:hypothetical protein
MSRLLGTLGDDLFILFNTFLEALKLHIFKKKILNTLGDALSNCTKQSGFA